MVTMGYIQERLETVFEHRQARVLTEVITEAYGDLVKAGDFQELKEIVKELAEAQHRTETRLGILTERVDTLTGRMDALAEAQHRTETRLGLLTERVDALAEAQHRTETRLGLLTERVDALAEAQHRTEIGLQTLAQKVGVLADGLQETRDELGGLSRSVGYALENETYRMLPKILQERYGIEMIERLIRREVGGKEVNIVGRAMRDGQAVVVVGEVKVRLDERRRRRKSKDVFGELEEKVEVVKKEYPKEEIVRVLVTHYATTGVLQKAKERKIIVIQSFEW
jgi:predicted transcriptional regulator